MTQRRVENTRVHFWTFSPVSVNLYTGNKDQRKDKILLFIFLLFIILTIEK